MGRGEEEGSQHQVRHQGGAAGAEQVLQSLGLTAAGLDLENKTKHLQNISHAYQSHSHTGARCSFVVRAFAQGAMGRRIDPSWVEPIEVFLIPAVLHDWCNKGRGMCYPVCGMMHIKEPLVLIRKSSLCGSSRFPFSLAEWSLTICLTPYNRK